MTGLAAIILLTSSLVAVGELPATAASTIDYVSLGDSYAAGVGGGSYLDACGRSPNGYPTRLTFSAPVALVANPSCNGASSADIASQLASITPTTKLVTVTVGANDLDVAGVAAACTSGTAADCQAALAASSAVLYSPGFVQGLVAALGGVAAAAPPRARIIVTGYPYLFDRTLTVDPTIDAINDATTALNASLAVAVLAVRLTARRTNIQYVDVSRAFLGHGIGSADPWINSDPTVDSGFGVFHPNATGYLAYAAAVRARL